MNPEFLKRAIEIARKSVESGGGPFGAVIAKDGKIIAEAGNTVTRDIDPSAHAEVNAIRKACRALGTHDLSKAEIYASCEPCPMCLSAIYWAHLSGIHFAAGRSDAAKAGFDDAFIYDELGKPVEKRHIPMDRILLPEANEPFAAWSLKKDKKEY